MEKQEIKDGIVNEVVYKDTTPKILFVLKQGYVKEDDPDIQKDLEKNGYDLREFLKGAVSGKYLFGHSYSTWNPIIHITNGILSGKTYKNDLPKRDEIIDCLNKIAVRNVIKISGETSTPHNLLYEHYLKNRERLIKEINEVKPDIIIFGGTGFLFRDDFSLNDIIENTNSKKWNFKSDFWKYEVKNNRLYIEMDHPSYFYRQNNDLRKEWINDIINIYLLNKQKIGTK